MRRVLFHSFNLGDVEDPDLYAAEPLYKFMKTPKGKWIKEYCGDPMYNTMLDPYTYGYKVCVYGDVEDKLATEYYLRWA